MKFRVFVLIFLLNVVQLSFLQTFNYEDFDPLIKLAIEKKDSTIVSTFEKERPQEAKRITKLIQSLLEEYNKQYSVYPLDREGLPDVREKEVTKFFRDIDFKYHFWHPCRNATKTKRIILLAKLLDDIEEGFPDKNLSLRISSIGSGGFFQEFLLIKELVKLGYKKIEINCIDIAYGEEWYEHLSHYAAMEMKDHLQVQKWANKINIKFYQHTKEYIDKAMLEIQPRSHVFLLVDPLVLDTPHLPEQVPAWSDFVFHAPREHYNSIRYVKQIEDVKKGRERYFLFSSTGKCLFWYVPKNVQQQQKFEYEKYFVRPLSLFSPGLTLLYSFMKACINKLKPELFSIANNIMMDFFDVLCNTASTNTTPIVYTLHKNTIKKLRFSSTLFTMPQRAYEIIAQKILPSYLGIAPQSTCMFIHWFRLPESESRVVKYS